MIIAIDEWLCIIIGDANFALLEVKLFAKIVNEKEVNPENLVAMSCTSSTSLYKFISTRLLLFFYYSIV